MKLYVELITGKISLIRMMSSTPQSYDFETLKVTKPSEYVAQVELNRPEKRNAQNRTFYRYVIQSTSFIVYYNIIYQCVIIHILFNVNLIYVFCY